MWSMILFFNWKSKNKICVCASIILLLGSILHHCKVPYSQKKPQTNKNVVCSLFHETYKTHFLIGLYSLLSSCSTQPNAYDKCLHLKWWVFSMCLSSCKGCMQLPDPKQFEQAIEVLWLLWNCASVFLENIYLKQNKQGLISPNFFPSARIIISPSSTLVLRPLKTLSMEFRHLTAQTSYFKAGYSYPQYILLSTLIYWG